MQLEEIQQTISELHGIGPKIKAQFARAQIFSISDLVLYFPRAYDDRSRLITLEDAKNLAVHESALFNTRARVVRHEYFGAKKILKIIIDDGSAQAALVCFNRDFLARQLVVGSEISVAGYLEFSYNQLQTSQFEYALGISPDFNKILALYPLRGDLRHKTFRNAIEQALTRYVDHCEEFLPKSIIEKYGFYSRAKALREIHIPSSHETLLAAQRRLAYEELFILQISLLRAKKTRLSFNRSSQEGKKAQSFLQKQVLQGQKFELTPGQENALSEILVDFDRPYAMARLIQGDVGSGKTIIAFLAAAALIEKGYQVALMAPTVLLARQHAEKAAEIFEPLGIHIALLAGSMSTQARKNVSQALKAGEIAFAIGTHTLFSESIGYQNLGLVIIDEQHRFGVSQRQALYEKAEHPHLLSMSATPIPQTLALTLYGDMDVSVIDTKPVGRLPIETHLAKLSNAQKVYDWVKKELSKGHQAYFVYPLINEEDNDELKAANSQLAVLAKIFPDTPIGLVHSDLSEDEKISVMNDFKRGNFKILVATSVVEVGVDVPNATVMVIEHAERFGLAALHQLRGRVGRSALQSYCFLVYSENLTEIGKERLRTLKETTDGFLISEKDLEIRGPGDLKGVEQSGFIKLRIANLTRDKALLIQAREDAKQILDYDPEISLQEHEGLKRFLSLGK